MNAMNRIKEIEAIETPVRTADGVLLARFLEKRDDAAFAELVARHGPMVFGTCRRRLGQHADAEDCFQAAFLSLATHAKKLTERTTVGPWLYTIARQIAAKALRSRRRRRWVFWGSLPEPQAATASEAHVDLDAALATLTEQERSAIVLCHLEGFSRSEAAKTLGWPEGTLSVRLSRALEKLRRRLGKPPLAILAGTMVVMVPDSLPAATVASVRHLREGTLVDWASPRTVELYRKAQPMRLLHRAGPVVAALLASLIIMLGAQAGWHWLQAQTPENQGKKKRFAAAVEEMQRQKPPQEAESKSSVVLQVSVRQSMRAAKVGDPPTEVRRAEFKVHEVLNGANVEHSFMEWSAMIPLLTQIAQFGSESIDVDVNTGQMSRLEVNQIFNNCKRAGFKTINYQGPQLYLGRPEDPVKSVGAVPSVKFTADLSESKEYLPDWTNGWYVNQEGAMTYYDRRTLPRSKPLELAIEASGGEKGPAFELLETFEAEEGKRLVKERERRNYSVSDLAKQIDAQQNERYAHVEIRLSATEANVTRMAVTQKFARGWATTLTTGSNAFAPLVKRITAGAHRRIDLNVGMVGTSSGSSGIRNWAAVDPLHVNLVLNACKKSGVDKVHYWGQEIVSGEKSEHSLPNPINENESIVRSVLSLDEVEGFLPEESNGWATVRGPGRTYVVKAADRAKLLERFSPKPPGVEGVERFEAKVAELAKLSPAELEKEIAKEPSLLRTRLKKRVEEVKAKMQKK